MRELFLLIIREKKDILLALIVGTLSGITSVALFAQSGLLISQAALMPPFYIILILTAFLKVFGVAKSTSKYAERLLTHRTTFRILSDIRLRFFDRLTPIASELFNRYQSGDLLARITNDVATLQNFFLRVVYPPLVALLVFLCTVIFTMFFSPWIALVLFFGFLLVAVIIPALFILKKQQPQMVKHQLMNETAEFLYGFKELKHYNQLGAKTNALLALSETYTEEVRKEQQTLVQMQLLNQVAALFTIFIVIFLGAYFVANHSLDGLYLAMLILIALTVFETAIPLATVPYHYNQSEEAMERLQLVGRDKEVGSVVFEQSKSFEIRAENVTFQYREDMKHALKDICFTIQPGEKIAIVGPSGSGKSTLFQLLIKSFSATDGELFGHNLPYNEIDADSLWQLMAIQLQHNHFFSGTVRENLQIADEHAVDGVLENALQRAHLSLPLDHDVLEKGENLSGGEKQRLAFARVLLKNSSIWLLDEPFTSLDAETEQALFQEMLSATTGKTLLFITHKLTGLEKMDRIFVMQDGLLIESGHYDELMDMKGLFFEMRGRAG